MEYMKDIIFAFMEFVRAQGRRIVVKKINKMILDSDVCRKDSMEDYDRAVFSGGYGESFFKQEIFELRF